MKIIGLFCIGLFYSYFRNFTDFRSFSLNVKIYVNDFDLYLLLILRQINNHFNMFCISQYICTVYEHCIVRRGKKALKAPQFIKDASGFIIIQKKREGKKKRKKNG